MDTIQLTVTSAEKNAGANAPTRLQTPSEAARAAGAHAPSGPTGTQAAKLVERRETGKAERQHLGRGEFRHSR